jgi:hypothetical protein
MKTRILVSAVIYMLLITSISWGSSDEGGRTSSESSCSIMSLIGASEKGSADAFEGYAAAFHELATYISSDALKVIQDSQDFLNHERLSSEWVVEHSSPHRTIINLLRIAAAKLDSKNASALRERLTAVVDQVLEKRFVDEYLNIVVGQRIPSQGFVSGLVANRLLIAEDIAFLSEPGNEFSLSAIPSLKIPGSAADKDYEKKFGSQIKAAMGRLDRLRKFSPAFENLNFDQVQRQIADRLASI